MKFFKHKWNQFIDYINTYKKNIIINYIILAIVTFSLLLIDLLTKHFLFEVDNQNVVTHQNWLFGIRSVQNDGLTFMPNLKASNALNAVFNVFIWIGCLIFLLFIKSKWIAVFTGFIFAGSLGNSIDRFAFEYVRDIVFLPWVDKGTFNFADVDVVFGCCGIIITMIVSFIKQR